MGDEKKGVPGRKWKTRKPFYNKGRLYPSYSVVEEGVDFPLGQASTAWKVVEEPASDDAAGKALGVGKSKGR